jgi:transcriptional regulator with XRE-family HTH domain
MAIRHRALTAFGSNVRRHRQREKLTQEQLAASADLDPTYISGIERGVRNPSILSVLRIADALGTTVSALSKGIDGPSK